MRKLTKSLLSLLLISSALPHLVKAKCKNSEKQEIKTFVKEENSHNTIFYMILFLIILVISYVAKFQNCTNTKKSVSSVFNFIILLLGCNFVYSFLFYTWTIVVFVYKSILFFAVFYVLRKLFKSFLKWKERDSNPRYREVYTLSRRAL